MMESLWDSSRRNLSQVGRVAPRAPSHEFSQTARTECRALPNCLLSVSICVQVVKTLINIGFLARVDGHCQRNCQFCGGCKHNSPQFFSIPLKLAHYTLTCRGGSGA